DVRQVKEYRKMNEYLDQQEDLPELIIVGYGMNSDDNHVNSMIKSFILSGGTIVNFWYVENKPNTVSEEAMKIEYAKNKMFTTLRLDDRFKNQITIKLVYGNQGPKILEQYLK